jgi:hypothetical protein
VAKDGFGNSGRKAFWSQVAAGAILSEDARAFIFMLLRGMRGWLILVCLRAGGAILLRGLGERNG